MKYKNSEARNIKKGFYYNANLANIINEMTIKLRQHGSKADVII